MRILQCLPCFVLFVATAAQAVQAPPSTAPTAPSSSAVAAPATSSAASTPTPAHEQRYADFDGDGWCDNVVVTTGGKTWAKCKGTVSITTDADCNDTDPNVYPGAVEESADDGIDQNCDKAAETEVDGAKAKSLASWTLFKTVARGPYTDGYLDVFGQVGACLKEDKDWEFGTCNCGPGYAWRAWRDVNGAMTGACDLKHGGGIRTPGNGGVDSKARKVGEDNAKALEAHKAEDTTVHTTLQSGIDASNAAINALDVKTATANAAQDAAIGTLGRNLATTTTAVIELTNKVGEVETAVVYAQDTADEAMARQEDHKKSHPENGFELGGTFASQSFVKDSGKVLRGDGYNGLVARGGFGGRFLDHGFAQVFLEGAAVSETADVAGVSTSLAGFRGAFGFQAGGVIPVGSTFELSPVAFIGYGGSSTAGANKVQGGVTGKGVICGGAIYGWLGQVGLGLRVTERFERTEHSVLFETNDQNVTAGNLKPVSRPGATTTVLDLVVAMRF